MLLIAKVKRVVFTNDDYHVLNTDQGVVVVYADSPPKKGKTYQFKGESITHHRYGKQFRADECEPSNIRRLQSNRDNALFGSSKFDNF